MYIDTEIQYVIKKYWSIAAPKYSEKIQSDLCDEYTEAWLSKILRHAPQKKNLAVLETGCGPGFLSIILSKAGHTVTAVDCTDEMLTEAKKNSCTHGANVVFLNMDAHKLDFEDSSFDLVISRNLTWTLYNPVEAYKEWKRVLQPQGRIIIFDANYANYCFDKTIAIKKQQDEDAYKQVFGVSPKTNQISDEYIKDMFLSDKKRPEWDIGVFNKLNMNVYTEENISGELYNKRSLLLNATSPLFMVVAEKI